METSTIINSIVSLFLIMLVGFYGSKKGIITDKLNRGLTDLLLQITLPLMIISSFTFTYNESVKNNVFKTFYYSFGTFIIIAALSYIITIPIKKEKKTILHFANIFTNTGYVGFPILNVIYGPEAVVYGSIFNIFFNIFLWTYGVMIFKGKLEKKELGKEVVRTLLNPSLIAVYIGIAIVQFDISVPRVIISGISPVGSMTGPLSMIIIGAMSAHVSLKEHLRDWTIYYGVVSKTIIIPIALYIVSILINDGSIVSNSVIILASMPAAAMTSIFAESFNVKRDYANIIVISTTLFSILTLPVLLSVIIR